MRVNGELQVQQIKNNLIEQKTIDSDSSLFDFDKNNISDNYDEFLATNQLSNMDIEDLDLDTDLSYENIYQYGSSKTDESQKSEVQVAADKLTYELFGNINIPTSINEYTGLTSISKSELNSKLGTNYNKSYASQATIEFTKRMHGTDKVKYVDEKGAEHEINSKEDLKKYQLSVPENPQDIPVGSIVTMDDPKGGNFHSGLVVGYTENGKALVMEANSAQANGGAAVVAYDFNSSNAKSIKGYIPVEGLKDEKPNEDINLSDKSENITEQPEEEILTEDTKVSTIQEEQQIENVQQNEAVEVNTEDEIITELPDTEISENNSLTETEELAQNFINKVFGNEIEVKDFSADNITNDAKGHYIKAGSTTKKEFESNLGINYGSKYASQAAIDMAKSMYGLNSNDILTDNEGNKIESKADIQKLGKDIPQTTGNEQPVPTGSMVISDDPKGGNFHAGIVVGYTNDGRAIVAEANSAKSSDGQGAALAVYSFNSNDEKSIKKYIPINTEQTQVAEDSAKNTQVEVTPKVEQAEKLEETTTSTISEQIGTQANTTTQNDNVEMTIQNASKYLGMTEKEVEKATGKSFCNGYYCADFVHAVLDETFGSENLPEWYTNCTNKSSCSDVLEAAQDAGYAFTDPDEVQNGHLYLVVFNTKRGRARHIGFLNNINGSSVNTIEGNSTKGRVCERTYDKSNTKRINSYILLA